MTAYEEKEISIPVPVLQALASPARLHLDRLVLDALGGS